MIVKIDQNQNTYTFLNIFCYFFFNLQDLGTICSIILLRKDTPCLLYYDKNGLLRLFHYLFSSPNDTYLKLQAPKWLNKNMLRKHKNNRRKNLNLCFLKLTPTYDYWDIPSFSTESNLHFFLSLFFFISVTNVVLINCLLGKTAKFLNFSYNVINKKYFLYLILIAPFGNIW